MSLRVRAVPRAAARGFRRQLRRRRTQVILFFGILGPGLITSNADNDAGGIFTYAVAGARYGYDMIWLLAVTTGALVAVQAVNAPLAVATGQGLAHPSSRRFGAGLTPL